MSRCSSSRAVIVQYYFISIHIYFYSMPLHYYSALLKPPPRCVAALIAACRNTALVALPVFSIRI
ncbi:hypothetical protein J3F84DRAFT_364698 [Trichoderma pleuroticola]